VDATGVSKRKARTSQTSSTTWPPLLEHGQITLPQPRFAKELIEELEAFSYSATDSTPAWCWMAAPGAGHDDTVIALALAAWGNRPTSVCRVQFWRDGSDPEQVLADHLRSRSMPSLRRRSLFDRCTRGRGSY